MNTPKIIVLLSLLAVFTSCSKTDDSIPASNQSGELKQKIVNDVWIISSYIDKSKNETHNYSGYTFEFSANGTLTANVSGTVFTGSWSIGSEHSGSDDSSHQSDDSNKLIISITGNEQMEEVSDDFQIVSFSDQQIILKDDNPLKIKELIFQKK